MLQSLHHGEICRLSKVDGFADGVAVEDRWATCASTCARAACGWRDGGEERHATSHHQRIVEGEPKDGPRLIAADKSRM